MGAINFSLDRNLIRELKKSLPLTYFVETGTFKGDTIEHVKSLFDKFKSVELSCEYYECAKSRFKDDENIEILYGDSKELLPEIVKKVQGESVLYWLDAHWCVADATAGEISQCPLVDEILSINQLNDKSVIVIDDARMFLAPPPAPHEISQWPDINSIISALNKISNNHFLMIVNDCVIYYPEDSSSYVREYATRYGIDILNIHDKARDYDELLIQLKEKEQEIKEKDQEIDDMEIENKEKDDEINEKENEIDEKEEEIENLEHELDERGDVIKGLHHDLNIRKQDIVRLNHELHVRDIELKIKDTKLEKGLQFKDNEMHQLNKVCEERLKLINSQHKAIKRYHVNNKLKNFASRLIKKCVRKYKKR